MAVVPREGYPAPDPAWLARAFPGREDRVEYLGRPATRAVVDGPPSACRRRPLDPLPRPRGRGGLHRRNHCTDLPSGGPTARDRTRPQPEGTARSASRLPRAASPPAPEMPALDLARRIVELAEDKKAADIVLLDLTGLTTVADYFVIASGGSERQLDAIADGVISGMRDEKVHAFGREGTAASHWVLVDFGSVDRPRLHAAGARLLPAREGLARGQDDPARAVARGPAARRTRLATRRPYGVPEYRRVMSRTGLGRSIGACPSLEIAAPPAQAADQHPVRRDLPPARPERAPVLRHPGRPVRGLPPAVHRSRPHRAARSRRRTLHLRDRERPRAPGARLVDVAPGAAALAAAPGGLADLTIEIVLARLRGRPAGEN